MFKVKAEMYLWFFQTGIDTGFEVSEIAKNTLFKLFHILNGSSKGFESEYQGSHDICSSDMIETTP